MHPDQFIAMLAALAGDDLIAVSEPHLARTSPSREARGGAVSVIPVTGVLMPRGGSSWFGSWQGMDALRQRIATAAADPNVASIVLDMDSPGGTVAGTAETAAAVASAAERKPVVAVANTLAASAAFWIASQASEVVLAPNALVGSIGVVAVHQDLSKAFERMGVTTTFIASGARKAEGNPFQPLSDDAKAAMQARVDEAAGAFIDAVAAGRKMSPKAVREKAGDGRVLGTREAVDLGLADRVATLDEVVAGLAAGRGRVWRRRSALPFL